MKAKSIVVRARNTMNPRDEVVFTFEDIELREALKQTKKNLSMMRGKWKVVCVYVNGERIATLDSILEVTPRNIY